MAVEIKFGRSEFEKRHYTPLALMCTYGIELLMDDIAECRANMPEILAEYLSIDEADDLCAASYVLSQNLMHGDALTMCRLDGQPVTFAEWGYIGEDKFQRRDFRFDVLIFIGSSARAEGSLFAHLGKHEICMPTETYPPMTVSELAVAAHGGHAEGAA